MSEIEFTKFIRKPFSVLAVQVTMENMKALAKLVGEVQTENGETFILLDRRIVPNVTRAKVGWWVTKLGDNYHCYSQKIFKQQFMQDLGTDLVSFTQEELAAAGASATR
jgi:hypothetical protein